MIGSTSPNDVDTRFDVASPLSIPERRHFLGAESLLVLLMVSLVPDPPSGEWHAPGAGALARLEALSTGLEAVLDGLGELSLTGLSDDQVAGLVHQLAAATELVKISV